MAVSSVSPALPELLVHRWISQDSEQPRARGVLEICKALFDKYDADHDGVIDICQFDMDNCNRESSPRGYAGNVCFGDFLKHMTNYEGDVNDEASLDAYFDTMPDNDYRELIENLNDDCSSQLGKVVSIRTVLGKLVSRSELFNQESFWEKVKYFDSSTHNQIFQTLKILLQTAEEIDDTQALISETRYQEILLAAKRAFSRFDADSDGSIVRDEFKSVFGLHFERCHSTMPAHDLELYSSKFATLQMDQFDENADGKVSFDEFFDFLCLEGYDGDRTDKRSISKFFGTLSQETIDEILDVIKFYELACVDQESA